ncbi:MAG TPA: glycoside hydrolase family 36 protein, partial [Anaerolineae bacterium]|nr:glycoside hydrolase family 36 protein [Anaerolineae bacterium]
MIDFIERDGHLNLSSAALRFEFDASHGRFSIGCPDATAIIRNATARARLATLVLDTSALKVASSSHDSIESVHGPGEQLAIAFQPERDIQLTFHASLYRDYPFLALRLVVTNRSAQTHQVEQLTPLRTGPGSIRFDDVPAPLSFFKNGYQSWSYSGVRHPNERDVDTRLGIFSRPLHFNLTTPISRTRGVFWSEMFGAVISHADGKAIVAGQITSADQFAQVHADTRAGRATLTLTCDADDVPVGPGQSITSEEMLVQIIDLPAADPFADYFDAVARRMMPRRPALRDAGWCSWYHRFGRVREEDVLASLGAADERRETMPIDLIQIDDGYQTKVGDWLSINDKFPHGMRWLADRIRETGHTPGLWLAPFIAVKSSKLARQHPDWLIRDQDERLASAGRSWNASCYGLDVTHPGAQDYVRRVIDAATHEWGYSYLKLDFLYAAALPGLRHDRRLTRAQTLRRGLELVRETAGDEVFLLGCGCPLGPAIGIVDGMRIGPDIALDPEPAWTPRFKGVTFIVGDETSLPAGRNAARNTLVRSGMHRRWWLNDPDCLIVRDARHMNESEVRSWASLVGLSGGLLVLGDGLPAPPERRMRYITSLLPPPTQSALPLDVFEREMPELYVLRQDCDWGSGVVAGVFNWSDRPQRRTIDLARFGLDP